MINLEIVPIVAECLKNDSLVKEFCRLYNVKRPDRLSPIEKMIDDACGNDSSKEFFDKFFSFVEEFIVPTLPPMEGEIK